MKQEEKKEKKRRIVPPEKIAVILAKLGKECTKEELVEVFNWLKSETVEEKKEKKKRIVPPEAIAVILGKPGKDCTEEELVEVFNWLKSETVEEKKKRIVPPEEIAVILDKLGKDWTEEELVEVFNWLTSKGVLDEFIWFAFGFTRDFKMAMDVVNDKITYVFRYRHTYDPAKSRGKNNAFLNYLYTIIARGVVKEVKAEIRRVKKLAEMQVRQIRDAIIAQAKRDAEMVNQIRLQRIKERYLPRLKPIYRRAIQLVDFEGYTYIEAAGIEGVGVSCMKVRVMRARQQIIEMEMLEMNDKTRKES